MQNLKSVFGVIGTLVPVVYCGGLIFYFLDLTGSAHDAKEVGLGPTLLGLGIVGLIFCVPLILKIVRLIARPRFPGSGGSNDGDSGFDADAVIARYRTQESAVSPSPARPSNMSNTQDGRQSFGRRSR